MSSSALEQINNILSEDEIITPDDPRYAEESSVWAAQKDLHPTLVVRPKDTSSLSKLLKYLNGTNLNIKIRSLGHSSASAKDVLISMTAFDDFAFDRKSMTVTIGAGQAWRDYYTKMEAAAPDCTVVACRTPCIGLGGSLLSGGFGWLSAEYGCGSDPGNMLDAEVVKMDGTVLWASEEPELLWALRGSLGGFGAVTRFKLRAFDYTQKIYSGSILVPRSSWHLAKPGIVKCAKVPDQKKVSLYFFCMKKEALAAMGAQEDMLILSVYDANGEAHGRGEDGFKWALDIPGAIDADTKERNMRETAALHESFSALKGKIRMYWNGLAAPELTEEVVQRSFDWFENYSQQAPGTVKDHVYGVFEAKCSNDVNGPIVDAAWPRPKGFSNMLLMGAACSPDGPEADKEEQYAKQMMIDVPKEIMGSEWSLQITPNSREEYHDDKATYGKNYERLRELKRKVDPNNKLGGPIKP